jgi:hypothetical protein
MAAVALVAGVAAGVCWRALAPSPNNHARIDDTAIPAEHLLSHAPGVRGFHVLVYADQPKQRIIQIDDAHYVKLADFTHEARERSVRSGVEVTDEDIRRLYCNYVDDLLDLREDQLTFLRWLVDAYGLNYVFDEGLWDDAVADFVKGAERLRNMKPTLSDVANAMRPLPRLAQESAQDRLRTVEREKTADKLLQRGIGYGAVGRLIIERPFVKVLPAEEHLAFDEGSAEIMAGINGEKAKRREAIIVSRLLAHKGCSVIVLGAGHDLSKEIRMQSHGNCDYVKVTPARFPSPPLRSLGETWPTLTLRP